MNKQKGITLGIFAVLLVGAAIGLWESGSTQTTVQQKVIYYVANGDIYEMASNTTGERQITKFGDVYRILDQRGNGRNATVLFIRKAGFNPESDTDTTFGASLWVTQVGARVDTYPLIKEQVVMDGRLFPDGKEALYRLYTAELFRMPIEGGTPKKIAEKVLSPALSPDGTKIVYQKLNPDWEPGFYGDKALGLHVLNIMTGEEKKLSNTWEDFDPSWSADGTQILFSSGRQPIQDSVVHLASIWVMGAEGQNQTQITNVGQAEYGPNSLTAPSRPPLWSKDKRHLVYEADRAIHTIELDSNAGKMINHKIITYGTDPHWLENGKSIAVMNLPSSTKSPKATKFDLEGNINP